MRRRAISKRQGRAGRDGLPAEADCCLVDARAAVEEAARQVAHQWPDHHTVRNVLQALANHLSLAVGAMMDAPARSPFAQLGGKGGLLSIHGPKIPGIDGPGGMD